MPAQLLRLPKPRPDHSAGAEQVVVSPFQVAHQEGRRQVCRREARQLAGLQRGRERFDQRVRQTARPRTRRSDQRGAKEVPVPGVMDRVNVSLLHRR